MAECKKLNADRVQPAIEICSLDDSDLASLAKKTFILITTVGPYGKLGEHAFKACAENGTHYLDVTGEVPFVAKMLKKYEAAAKASGATMFPQIGIESAPADLVTWSLASFIRSEFSAGIRDVTVSIHNFKFVSSAAPLRPSLINPPTPPHRSAPSGGTFTTFFTILDNFSLSDLRAAYKPYALSPLPRPTSPQSRAPRSSLLTRLTGLVSVPSLGLLTTSLAGSTDAAIVQRTWGLLATLPPPRRGQAYGPHFSFREYMRPRNWLTGVGLHVGIMLLGLVMVMPLWLRQVVLERWGHRAGEGPDPEKAKGDEVEYRGVGKADDDEGGKAFCKAWFRGSTYYREFCPFFFPLRRRWDWWVWLLTRATVTGILLAEAAATLLQEDVQLGGGVYTPACLGQPFIDRLDRAGFHFETKRLEP